ncbi:hypothetical protein [Pseudomonas orientalis]|uniref:Uncharacterized protein n=1 Tax=Pseudomonas orientalis TaxID=76758 RepID=A0A2L0RTV3_9PSED|nr:hypothetical protein [Pseudomonas orientalis]AUZ45376.1 hypothetical protein BOP93_07115 [Pseudomonas orientalis]
MSKFNIMNKKAELEINQNRLSNEILLAVQNATPKTVAEKKSEILKNYLSANEGTNTKDNIAKGNDFNLLLEGLDEFNMPYKQIHKEKNWQFSYLAKLGALLLLDMEGETDKVTLERINNLKKMALRPKDRAMLDFDV